ncbi:hypothetical protein SDC9_169272 [bioreactor metagenome]|uniref:Uncharacterized protein n=1 Tax=bioreactor metagenome TaxID=1076179 RepID=A0A645G7D3_9ZZZZ
MAQKSLRHGQDFRLRRQIERLAPEGQPGAAAGFGNRRTQQSGGEIAQRIVIAAGDVIFEHGEFLAVLPAMLIGAETGAKLVDFFQSGGQEHLHFQLGTRPQELARSRNAVDILLRRRRRDPDRGLHFEKPVRVKISPEPAFQSGPKPEIGRRRQKNRPGGMLRSGWNSIVHDRKNYALLTRSAYSPVRVSMRTMSPSLMKSGT